MPKLNREQRREIQKYNKEKFDLWVGTYAMENYNAVSGKRTWQYFYNCMTSLDGAMKESAG